MWHVSSRSGVWQPCELLLYTCYSRVGVVAAVDCEVGPWRDWGECDVRCGPGVRQRTRPVTRAPLNGGAACPPTVQKTACDGARCKYPRAPGSLNELRGASRLPNSFVHLLSPRKLSRGIMESPAYVCLFVRLSVCLLPR